MLFEKTSAVAIFTDCDDKNARHRQSLRVQQLFGVTPIITGVTCELDAAGQIVDALDAATHFELEDERRGNLIILANIAPRNGAVKYREKNGSPFCYFTLPGALVFSTLHGEILSLADRLTEVRELQVLNIPRVADWARNLRLIDETTQTMLSTTQFRSFEFLPRCARWIVDGKSPPSIPALYPGDPELRNIPRVWAIDKFGNIKTTIDLCVIKPKDDRLRNFRFFRCLSEVPDDGKPAWVIGSSGYKDRRFAEIVINGGSAAKHLSLKVGDDLRRL